MASDFIAAHRAGGYESEASKAGGASDVAAEVAKSKHTSYRGTKGTVPGMPRRDIHTAFDKPSASSTRRKPLSQAEKREAFLRYGGDQRLPVQPAGMTDEDVLRQEYKFDRQPDEFQDSYETRFARKYESQLFKEYAICEFGPKGQMGLRWRVRQEVESGKGQFVCANKECSNKKDLHSYELNFAYQEKDFTGAMVTKQTLVKVRLCAPCGYRLNEKKILELKKKEERSKKRKKEKKEKKTKKKKRREKLEENDESDQESESDSPYVQKKKTHKK